MESTFKFCGGNPHPKIITPGPQIFISQTVHIRIAVKIRSNSLERFDDFIDTNPILKYNPNPGISCPSDPNCYQSAFAFMLCPVRPPGGLGERTNPQTIRLTTIYSANSSPGRCIFCIRLLSDMFRTKSVFIVPVSHTSSRTVATGNNNIVTRSYGKLSLVNNFSVLIC